MAVEVANIYSGFHLSFLRLGRLDSPVTPWVPNPLKEAATPSPHDIKSNRCDLERP